MQPVARSVFGSLALGALSVVAPATAEESETVTAVYFGAEDSAENAGAVETILTLLDPPVTPGAPPVHLDQHFEPGVFHVLGARASHCTGSPVELATYEALLTDLYRATMALEDTAIIHKSILAAQPCLSAPATAELLARVHFLEGVNQFDLDQDKARDSFRLVHAIDPTCPWDDSYSPSAQMCFADAKLQVLGQHKVPIRLFVPAQATIWLDGAPLDTVNGDPEVFPGRHLVQFRETTDGPLRSVAIQVEPEREVAVFDPRVLATADQAGLDAITTAVLRHLASIVDAGVPDYVVALAPEIVIWRWDGQVEATASVETPAQAKAHLTGQTPTIHRTAMEDRGKPSPAVPILIGAGAVLVAVGAILTGEAYDRFNEVKADYHSEPDEAEEYAIIERSYHRHNTGIGLMAGGGVALAISIPVGIITARGREQAAVTAAVQLNVHPDAGADPRVGLDGAILTMCFRPPR